MPKILRDQAIGTVIALVSLGVAITSIAFTLEDGVGRYVLLSAGVVLIAVGILAGLSTLRDYRHSLSIQVVRSQHTRPLMKEVLGLKISAKGTVEEAYGRVVSSKYDEQACATATHDAEGNVTGWVDGSQVPLFVPVWLNHDLYLRWTGSAPTERHCIFSGEAILEVAIDTWENGNKIGFLAATLSEGQQQYVLHPNHTYRLTIEVGAKNARSIRRAFRLSVSTSTLEAGLRGAHRLELTEEQTKEAKGGWVTRIVARLPFFRAGGQSAQD